MCHLHVCSQSQVRPPHPRAGGVRSAHVCRCRVSLKLVHKLELGCHDRQLVCPCPPPHASGHSRQWHTLPLCVVFVYTRYYHFRLKIRLRMPEYFTLLLLLATASPLLLNSGAKRSALP